MTSFFIPVSLNGSGAGSAQSDNIFGQLESISVSKVGMTNNPVVTITENYGVNQVLLNGVTVSSDTQYNVRVAPVDNAGSTIAGNPYVNYYVWGRVTVSVTGGDNNGKVEVWIKVRN